MAFSGGGVVAEIFRDRRKLGRFSGGGVVAEMFGHNHKPATFRGRGGGVVGEFFFFFGNMRSRSIKLPQFREFFGTFPGHLEITHN